MELARGGMVKPVDIHCSIELRIFGVACGILVAITGRFHNFVVRKKD
jgi:hypothetical protein